MITHGPSLVTNGLITFYDFNSLRSYVSGTGITDISGSGNAGTFSGATTVSSGYASFAGTTNITTASNFNNPQVFSVSIWFNTTSTTGKKLFGFESNQTGTASTSYDRMFVVDTTGSLYWGWNTGTNQTFSYGNINTGAWFNAIVTFNSGTQVYYLNGSQVGSNAGSAAQNYSGYWRIGGYKSTGWSNSSDGYFTGNVGPVLVYNRILSATEVAQNFNAHRGRYSI